MEPVPDQATEPELASVIDFEPFLKRKHSSVCEHDQADVDDAAASLTCRTCGAELDPWWYLRRLAHEEIEMFEQLERVRAEIAAAIARGNQNIAKLNAEIMRLQEVKTELWNEQIAGRSLGAHAAYPRRRKRRA